MEFTAGAWWLVTLLVGAVTAVLSFYLKRTANKVDEHDREIPRLTRSADKVEEHEKQIAEIQRTYVTKDEMSAMRKEIKDELRKISGDVAEIKASTLSKADFIRTSARTDEKIDKLYDLLVQRGGNHGQTR